MCNTAAVEQPRSGKLCYRAPGNRRAAVAAWAAAGLVATLFVWLLFDLAGQGVQRLDWSFLTEAPLDSGRRGGIGSVLVSTGLIVATAIVVAAPIAMGSAILLAERAHGGSLAGHLLARSLDVLASVPSIVFGLFGNAFFCLYLGLGFSIAAGGLTLACMILPILIHSGAAGLRAVPAGYRMAAAALGLSRTTTLLHLLLPAATPYLTAGLILGIGRAAAETAALIYTSGYVDRMPASLSDSGRSLAVHIYDLTMNVSGGDGNAHAAALVLVCLLLAINLAARHMMNCWKPC